MYIVHMHSNVMCMYIKIYFLQVYTMNIKHCAILISYREGEDQLPVMHVLFIILPCL